MRQLKSTGLPDITNCIADFLDSFIGGVKNGEQVKIVFIAVKEQVVNTINSLATLDKAISAPTLFCLLVKVVRCQPRS
jgi:hypothetical protein